VSIDAKRLGNGAGSHAEALRKSMPAMINQHLEEADPKYWAPFVAVGEPVKP
jgi:CHAT domain-containing protein